MKKLCFSLLAVLASGNAFAQTCASPLAFNTPGSGPTASGTTCGAANDLGDLCDSFPSPQADVVYTFTLAPGFSATSITLSTSDVNFNSVLALLGPGGTCSGFTSCVRTASGAAAGANEVLSLTGLGNGVYYLIVSNDPAGAAGACGPYTITANGTLPVQLQNFSVE